MSFEGRIARGLETGGRILVAEGAMGTMLLSMGLNSGEDSAMLNLSDPDAITRVHALYAEAGATLATTNSFTVCASEDADVRGRAHRAVQRSVALAREGNPEGLVLGDVGPCSAVLQPLGEASFREVLDAYRRHIQSLVEGPESPDAIIFETFIDIADLRCAMLACRDVCDLPMIASCTFNESGKMPLSSTPPEISAAIAEMLGAAYVGINCGLGPAEALEVIRRMRSATTLPLIVQPNAGLPLVNSDGSVSYPGTPSEMACLAPEFVSLGAAIVGSCCGSDPTFTRAIADAVSKLETAPASCADIVCDLSKSALSMSSWAHPGLDGAFDLGGASSVDCGDAGLDVWDVLESVADAPMVMHDEGGFSDDSSLSRLEMCLEAYPGRALVEVAGEIPYGVQELIERYCAIAVDEKGWPIKEQ